MKKFVFLSALLICSGITLAIMFCTAYIIYWTVQGSNFGNIISDMGIKFFAIPTVSFLISFGLLVKDLFKKQ